MLWTLTTEVFQLIKCRWVGAVPVHVRYHCKQLRFKVSLQFGGVGKLILLHERLDVGHCIPARQLHLIPTDVKKRIRKHGSKLFNQFLNHGISNILCWILYFYFRVMCVCVGGGGGGGGGGG